MKREPYRDNPFLWGRAQRQMHDANYFNPIEVGHRPWWIRLAAWFGRWF